VAYFIHARACRYSRKGLPIWVGEKVATCGWKFVGLQAVCSERANTLRRGLTFNLTSSSWTRRHRPLPFNSRRAAIPIVFVDDSDPVGSGFVAGLPRALSAAERRARGGRPGDRPGQGMIAPNLVLLGQSRRWGKLCGSITNIGHHLPLPATRRRPSNMTAADRTPPSGDRNTAGAAPPGPAGAGGRDRIKPANSPPAPLFLCS
jgi:hypothetical protein